MNITFTGALLNGGLNLEIVKCGIDPFVLIFYLMIAFLGPNIDLIKDEVD